MSDLITVKAKGDKSAVSRVVFWERNEAHPNGEVFLNEGETATVAITPAVHSLLKQGLLIQLEGKQRTETGSMPESAPVGNVAAAPAPAAVVSPATATAVATTKRVGAKK